MVWLKKKEKSAGVAILFDAVRAWEVKDPYSGASPDSWTYWTVSFLGIKKYHKALTLGGFGGTVWGTSRWAPQELLPCWLSTRTTVFTMVEIVGAVYYSERGDAT